MKFTDLKLLRLVVLILLAIYFVVSLLSITFDFLEVGLLNRMEAGNFASYDEMIARAEANDQRQQLIAFSLLGIFIVAGIFALIWTFLATRNAASLSVLPQQITAGWSVVWYFVPVLNLWKPFQAMSELWRRSAGPGTMWASGAVGVWWFLWIVGGIFGRLLRLAVRNAETIEALRMAAWLSFWSGVLTLPLIVVYAWLISRITSMQAVTYAGSQDRPRQSGIVD